MDWIDSLRFDSAGLVPVVTQDARTGEVLMLAYANREALARSRATGDAHYWSRSRGEIWRKGATSGHEQRIVEIRLDCDEDAVLYRVEQRGPACHTLERSCFHRQAETDGTTTPAPDARPMLVRLEELVAERERERPEGSYSTYLFEQGLDKILKKFGEEALESVIAAKSLAADPADGGLREALVGELADLLFHMTVLLRERGVPLAEVEAELTRRFGQTPRPLPGGRARPDA